MLDSLAARKAHSSVTSKEGNRDFNRELSKALKCHGPYTEQFHKNELDKLLSNLRKKK